MTLRECTKCFIGVDVSVEIQVGGLTILGYSGKIVFRWFGGSLQAICLGKTYLMLSWMKEDYQYEVNSIGPGLSSLRINLSVGGGGTDIYITRKAVDYGYTLLSTVMQKQIHLYLQNRHGRGCKHHVQI
jgi:hypothetical protein